MSFLRIVVKPNGATLLAFRRVLAQVAFLQAAFLILPGVSCLFAQKPSPRHIEGPPATINASPESPLYLYSHFRDDDVADLRFSYSRHPATIWNDVNSMGSLHAEIMRDPSVTYVPGSGPQSTGTFYFVVTPAVDAKIQFFSSTDLVTFSPIVEIDMSALVPGTYVAWAPEWWHDPQDGKYYFFVALSDDPAGATSSTAPMMPYLIPFSPADGRVMGSPIPLTLWGTTEQRTFDFFPYYDGSQYYLLYVDQQPGGTGGDVTQPIAFATADSLAGPYTQQTFDGTDYFGLGSFHTEAPTIFRLGETDCVRIVFDTWTVTAAGARSYAPVFRDSCTSLGALFSQISLVRSPEPLTIKSEHGTIIRLTDDRSAAIVYNAELAAQVAGN